MVVRGLGDDALAAVGGECQLQLLREADAAFDGCVWEPSLCENRATGLVHEQALHEDARQRRQTRQHIMSPWATRLARGYDSLHISGRVQACSAHRGSNQHQFHPDGRDVSRVGVLDSHSDV